MSFPSNKQKLALSSVAPTPEQGTEPYGAGSNTNTSPKRAQMNIALLTGGFDRPYAFGLTMAMVAKGVHLDVLGGAEVDSPEMHLSPTLNFLDVYGDPRKSTSLRGRIRRVCSLYARLFRYSASTKSRLFHILWNNKVPHFDRTLLTLYYKMLGKKIVLTAHNVNAGKRDGDDSVLNRLTLRIQYRLADHIFVHTEKMRSELLADFGVQAGVVTVIPFGINNSVPDTDLTPAEARRRLGIQQYERTILFFGAVRQYKGVEYLVDAFHQLQPGNYRLIIAGEPKKGTEEYLRKIQEAIDLAGSAGRIIQKLEFIRDEDTELYFKASDISVLPYTLVFQSGVLFLSYSFGLPVIASDVGSFSDDIVPGKTGLVFRSCDAGDLARALKDYFDSDLYRELDRRRAEIRDYARGRHSWDVVGDITRSVYAELLER
jgi:glycosyltransferase involved in cell wall biosynthesis